VCSALTTCLLTEWQTTAKTDTTDRICQAHTTCTALEYETVAAQAESDRTCRLLTVCTSTQWESTAQTATTDRVCTEHTTCTVPAAQHTAGQWISVRATGALDRVCSALTVCNYDLQYESEAQGRFSDRVCTPLTVCSETQYESTAKTLTTDRVCTAHTTCTFVSTLHGSGQYISTTATGFRDRVCTALTMCDYTTQYELRAPQQFSDRNCADLTVCGVKQHETRAKTAIADRRCKDNTVCVGSEYQTKAPTYLTDRTCASHKECDYTTQWQSVAPGPLNDRECTAITICLATEWETTGLSHTSDRVCTPHTICQAAQYEVTDAAVTSSKNVNYVGRVGGRWFASTASWSGTSSPRFPRFPDTVTIGTTMEITETATGAAEELVLDEGELIIAPDTEVDLGPRPTAASKKHDRHCLSCKRGSTCDGSITLLQCNGSDHEYQDEAGQTACKFCPVCINGYKRTSCGGSSPGICERCGDGLYKSGQFTCSKCLSGTFSLGGVDRCEDCGPGRFQGSLAKTSCKSCAVGKYAPDDGSMSCTACTGTNWANTNGPARLHHGAAGHTVCDALTTCTATQWETKEETLTSDRVCTAHTTCDYGNEYESVAPGTHSDRVCSPLAVCTATQWETRAKTHTTNRRCKNSTVCKGKEYETKALAYSSDRICTTHTTCALGQWESVEEGTHNDRECTAITTCLDTEWETKAFTLTSDRVCQAHTICTATQLQTKAAETHADRECQDHTTCTSTQWQTKAAGKMHDRECKACSSEPACKWDERRAGCGKGSNHPGACVHDCNSIYNCYVGAQHGKWLGVSAGWSKKSFPVFAERILVEAKAVTVSARARGAGRSVTINGGSIRIGIKGGSLQIGPKSCDNDEWETSPASGTTNRKCSEHTKCYVPDKPHTSGNWISKSAETAADRECTPLTTCNYVTEYESTLASSHNDRVCSPARVCADDEFQSKPLMLKSNRECHTIRSCSGLEFEVTAPTHASDRVCSPITTCSPTQWEVIPPTKLSDRLCRETTKCSTGTCQATAPWKHATPDQSWFFKTDGASTAMDKWCNRNCNAATPNCPQSRCTCSASSAHREYETSPAATYSDRVCTPCASLPACPRMEIRVGCGPGPNPGQCEFDCTGDFNCFIGPTGSSWFDAKNSWSASRFPAYPDRISIAKKSVVLRAKSGDAGKLLRLTGRLQIMPGGGFLTLGRRQPVDCEYTWKVSTCSATCGDGTKTMTPVVSSPAANFGKSCPMSYAKPCNLGACPTPVDCVPKWSDWGPSCPCGGGTQSRHIVSVLPPKFGGKACPAVTTERRGCLGAPCKWCSFHALKQASGDQRCQDEYQDQHAGRKVAIRAYTGVADGCRSHGKFAVTQVPCRHMPGLTESKCRALCMEHADASTPCKFVFFSPASGRGKPGKFEQDKCILYGAEPATTITSLTSTKCNEMRCLAPTYCPASNRFASSDRRSCCADTPRCSDGISCGAAVCATHPDVTAPKDCFCTADHSPVNCGASGSFTNACHARCALGATASSCTSDMGRTPVTSP
jgi:hypothetical protein